MVRLSRNYTFLTFLFHALTIKQVIENFCNYVHQSSQGLTSHKVQIVATEKMLILHYSFINRLIADLPLSYGHHNDTFIYQVHQRCLKNSFANFYRNLTAKSTLSTSSFLNFALKVYSRSMGG